MVGTSRQPAGRLKIVASIVLIQLALSAVRSAPPRATHADLCFREAGGIPIALPCPAPLLDLATANEEQRRRAGAPPCWWTATPERFADIPGLGASIGRRLAEARDAGLSPTPEALETVSGIGSVLAERVAAQLETACGPTSGAR